MNDEIVKDYEHDLDFMLHEAARVEIAKKRSINDFERGINVGMKVAFMSSAFTILYRLSLLAPKKHSFLSGHERQDYIDIRIELLIKEKTNASKTV